MRDSSSAGTSDLRRVIHVTVNEKERKRKMTTRFDGDDTISTEAVERAISELEAEIEGALPWKVKRSEFPYQQIAEFATDDEAENFIKAEDYDPDRVSVEEEDDKEVEREELEELTEFREDIRSTFGSYEYRGGITLISEDQVDEGYVREYYSENYGSWPDELDGYINWRQVAGDFLDGRDYARLNGIGYYDL